MTRKLSFVLGLVAVLLIGARPALAHHGGAAFDQTKQQTLQGTVTMLDFVNPHVVVWFDVANPDGTTTKWSGWLTAPNKLQRAGWTKHTLNHWYRAQSAIFDASLAYEFLGFAGPDAREGLASHMEKRPPNFSGSGPDASAS